MRLLVGSTPQHVVEWVGLKAYQTYFGQLITPRDRTLPYAVEFGVPWAVDNYAFTNFSPGQFIRLLDRDSGIPGCLWCAAPDVVGDAATTLMRFWEWRDAILSRGYRVALVAQDGLERLPIPWESFNALFIGGTTSWKLSRAAADLVREAKQRHLWVHMGRVNSRPRIRYAQIIGCDSVDGSSFARFKYLNKEFLPSLQTYQNPLWEGFSC